MKWTTEQRIFLTIIILLPFIIATVASLLVASIKIVFKAIRRSVWYKRLWLKLFPNDFNKEFERLGAELRATNRPALTPDEENYTPWNKEDIVGECDECGEILLKGDEIPGYSKIYECPSCGHPNGRM